MLRITKYMFMFREENTGKNHNIEISQAFFENVAKFKYFGKTLTKQNCMRDEI
jgi:hypothetical protein